MNKDRGLTRFTRREAFQRSAASAALFAAAASHAQEKTGLPSAEEGTTMLDFERKLAAMRFEHYRHPPVDIIQTGFRPVGGNLADFAVVAHQEQLHFFYIERRLSEGTPFYPGHEIYFGHASSPDFFHWEVHDPVMLIRPGTWEEAHVWAPCILRRGDEFVMAYTGVNRHLSQNIGLAVSRDLYDWRRMDSNPISPCLDKTWAAWRSDQISSCRDPHLVEQGGRIYMSFTAITRQGAACIALCSSADWQRWDDHGPILTGPAGGYEPRLAGGHPQGSLESSNLSRRRGRWTLFFHAALRDKGRGAWIVQSDRIDRFLLSDIRPFWPQGGYAAEVVKDRGDASLLACVVAGHVRFGQIDWADPEPAARFVSSNELRAWRST